MNNYKKLKNTWTLKSFYIEGYAGPVTLSLPEWQQYVASGLNTLYGEGGVIPGGTMQKGFGQSGAVYSGHVRQGYGYPFPYGI